MAGTRFVFEVVPSQNTTCSFRQGQPIALAHRSTEVKGELTTLIDIHVGIGDRTARVR